MWLQQWDQLLRIITIGLPVYLAVIVLLRVLGTRALSKNNAFDTVVSFALGSVLGAAVLTPELPGALALAAVLLLLVLQFVLAWLGVRIPAVRRLTTARPKLLLLEGAMREDMLRQARLSPDAIRAAVRAGGIARVEDVFAVVLETDGALSVIPEASRSRSTALEGVDGLER